MIVIAIGVVAVVLFPAPLMAELSVVEDSVSPDIIKMLYCYFVLCFDLFNKFSHFTLKK